MMPIMTVNDGSEVVVVGAGPAGLTTAIALAQAGLTTTLVAREAPADHRTTALLAGSITALETLGVWNRCAGQAAPLKVMRIVDATVRLIRAPEVHFSAKEIGLDAFGYNIENKKLVIRDSEARWVKRVFKEVIKKTSPAKIKKILDDNGVLPRRKGLWTMGSITALVSNTHYDGYYQFTDKKANDSRVR